MGRIEQYLKPNGEWSTWRRFSAVTVSIAELSAAIDRYALIKDANGNIQWDHGLERYLIGTALHESNFCVNERDTEANGFQSWGIFQISKNEAFDVGLKDANLLSLKESLEVMKKLTDRNAAAVEAAGGDKTHYDFWAYVAIAHNQGRKAATDTIKKNGMDWVKYKTRNPKIAIVKSKYGDDVCLKNF